MTDDMFRSVEEPVTLLGRRSLMNEVKNKDGAMSKTWQMTMAEPVQKKPRTSEDFKLFCQFILAYENYDSDKDESQDTVVSSAEEYAEKSESSSKSPDHDKPQSSTDTQSDTDNDSFDLITCFCGKPFAGRPMIECSKCLTWIHLRCAKVKKSDIPEIFICSQCKDIHK